MQKIKVHQNANVNYLDRGVKILELANKAYSLYLRQPLGKKRKLLDFVLLNCKLSNRTLYPTYRKPFDILAKELDRSNWRPQPDLNRCCRRERVEKSRKKDNKLRSDAAEKPSKLSKHNKLNRNNPK